MATTTATARERIIDALSRHPGATVTDLASAATLGRSSVAKTLTALEGEGVTARTRPKSAPGQPRRPHTWHLTETTSSSDATRDSAADGTGPNTSDTDPSPSTTEGPAIPAEPSTHDTTSPAVTSPSDDTNPTSAAAPASTESTGHDAETAPASDTPPSPADGEPVTETGTASTGGGDIATPASGTPAPDPAPGGGHRLAPGELREQVAQVLAALPPGTGLTPTQISKELDGRSSGAISNALDRLTAYGRAVLIKERPRTFAATQDTTKQAPAGGGDAQEGAA